MAFKNRRAAGRRLGEALARQPLTNPIVLGLPRGGVPVAYEVAMALGAPLDVIVVRKLGVPFQPELAMGAIGEDDVRVLNWRVIDSYGITDDVIAGTERTERRELERRATAFRGERSCISLEGRSVVIVDDGMATGSTAIAACQVARAEGATHVTLAVPVAPPEARSRVAEVADEFVVLETPSPFYAIGQFYIDFSQTPDREVIDCLERAARRRVRTVVDAVDEDLAIPADGVELPGHLMVPANAIGVVVFAHGSGSSRHSPRNLLVADKLRGAGIGTLLFDLLTPAEERNRANVFDVVLLGSRLQQVTAWLESRPEISGLPLAYFGASTGAAAALWAATACDVATVVSRGGRPDLAGAHLGRVRCPTLLIVGGADHGVLEMNRKALAELHCQKEIAIVAGATHLFEEPGALEEVARLATGWFLDHLTAAVSAPQVGV